MLVVCGYAFILLIDKVIIDSHSSHIGHSHAAQIVAGDDAAAENMESPTGLDGLDSPGADIREALDSINLKKSKSSSVAGQRPRLEDLRSPSGPKSEKHIHNEDCRSNGKTKKQM